MNKNTFYKDKRSWKRANDLLLMALNSEGHMRNVLARKAINANHDYVDAYVFLGDEASNPREREEWYRMAIAVGRRVLGEEFFTKYRGDFGEFPQTLSFLDGLQGLADELLYQGREEEAFQCYLELLDLNSTDDQGIRYSVFKILVARQRYKEARELLNKFFMDKSASWLYNDVLLSYLETGDTAENRKKLDQALIKNSFICELLLNPPDPINSNMENYDLGLIYEEAESFDYVITMAHLWAEESGILDWIKQIFEQKLDSKLKPPRSREKALLFADEGRAWLEQNEFLQAEKLFTLALKYQEDLLIRNDLSYCKLLLGKYQEVIELLSPFLNSGVLNPYGNSLAAEAAWHLGDEINTRRFLKQAIAQFEQGLKNAFLGDDLPASWYNLTVIIKDIAGTVGDHRLVISLYNRWKQYSILDEDLFQVGVAYFNLGNYQAAIECWEKIEQDEAWLLLKDYISAATAFITEKLPHLPLEYLTPFHLLKNYQVSEEPLTEMIESLAAVKLLVVAKLFDSETMEQEIKTHYVQVLTSLDQWGIDFGHTLLESKTIPLSWKVTVLFCLASKGYYKYGEYVSVVIDGQQQKVQINEKLFNYGYLTDQPDVQHLSYILSLFEEKNYGKIIDLAETNTCYHVDHYLVMHILAVAYYYEGQSEKTYKIAEWFFTQLIESGGNHKDDLLLLNAGLWTLLGEEEQKSTCLELLSTAELDQGLQELYCLLINCNS